MSRSSRSRWSPLVMLNAILTIALLAAFTALQHRFLPHTHGLSMATAAPLLLGPIRSFSKQYAMLRDLVTPTSGAPESIPHVLFDTQTYAQAGSASLQFFQSATSANASDPTLTNFFAGQLQAKQYFEIHRIFTIINAVPNTNATVAITGAAQDVELLHKTARGALSWNYNGRPYGPYPLSFFGRPGGPVPFYAAYGTGTAANNVITTGETEANGGYPVLGNLIIAPATNFSLTMTFNSTAISAATNIVVAMLGVLHRPIG